MIRSGNASEWLCSPFENWPSIEMPRSVSTERAVGSMKPSGCTPALSATMVSDAECRAIASAIWLRTQLPTQTNSTFTGSAIFQLFVQIAIHIVNLSAACQKALIGFRRQSVPIVRELQEMRVDRRVVRQLRVKRSREYAPLLHEHGMARVHREHLDAFAHRLDHRGADEHHLERPFAELARAGVNVACELASVAVAKNRNVEQVERLLRGAVNLVGQQNRPRAGAKERAAVVRKLFQRIEQPFFHHDLHMRAALAARKDNAVDASKILGPAHEPVRNAETLKRLRVGFIISLYRHDSDLHSDYATCCRTLRQFADKMSEKRGRPQKKSSSDVTFPKPF